MKTLLVTKASRMIDHVATGQNITLHRNMTANCSLRYAAHRMGISPSYLSDLEHGKRNWTEALVRRYQEAVK